MDDKALLERRHSVMGAASPLFYKRPLQLVKGEGVWVFDADGRRYLDCYNNVPHVGHCHPHVVKALCDQASTLNTHTRYLHETIVNYGAKLTATFEDELTMAHFCCSGTEASELALRIAKTTTGAQGIIVTDFCYHGNSSTIAALSTAFPGPEGIGSNIRTIKAPDPSREGADGSADDVLAAIESLERDGMKPAAIFFDTIFATEGMPPVTPAYVEKAVAHVRAAGGLYIADEVQPGFGRTGDNMWGYQHYGVVPDLVTLGKPMGNGHPLAGVVGKASLVNAFGEKAMYFNTFGGNPVSCAVGLAVLEVIENEGLVQNAHEVGNYVRAGLERLAEKYDVIGASRGRGLFFGSELVKDRATREPAPALAKQVVNRLREDGVLVSSTGRHDNILKVRPPMPFSTENADLLLATLDSALAAL